MEGPDTTAEIEQLKKQLAKARQEIQDLKLRLENVMLLLKEEIAFPKSWR